MNELLTAQWPELALAIAAALLMLGAALRLSWRALGGLAALALTVMAVHSGCRAWRGWQHLDPPSNVAIVVLDGPATDAELATARNAVLLNTPTAPRQRDFTLAGEPWALLLCAFIQLAAAVAALLGIPYLSQKGGRHGEYFALLAFAALGLTVLARAADFITLFLGLETASLALYCLVATLRDREKSLEGALKYFILGAAAAAFMLFGAALLYGGTGHFIFSDVFAATGDAAGMLLGKPLFNAGLILVMVALSFKLALAPFHMWAPDAYSGAPTPVTAFMMVATKSAVLAVLIRLALSLSGTAATAGLWSAAFIGLGLLTMFAANSIALVQRRTKRLFAYAAVSGSGFAALAIAGLALPGADAGKMIGSLVFYIVSYLFSTLGLLAALTLVEAPENLDEELKEFTGLARLRPKLAFGLAILLFSAAGLPGTAGFLGKFFILRELISHGAVWPALIAIVLTVVATAYYLRLIILIYMRQRDPDESYQSWRGGPAVWLIGICALLSLVFGLWPSLGRMLPLP